MTNITKDSWEDEVHEVHEVRESLVKIEQPKTEVIQQKKVQQIWIYDLDFQIRKYINNKITSLPILTCVPPVSNTVNSDKLSKILTRVGNVTGYKSSLMTLVFNILKYFDSGKTLDDYRKLEHDTGNVEHVINNMRYDVNTKQKKSRIDNTAILLMKKSQKTQKNVRVNEIKDKVNKKKQEIQNSDAELCINTNIRELKSTLHQISNIRLIDMLKRTLSFVSDDSPLFFRFETELMLHFIKYENLALFAELYEGSKNIHKNQHGVFDVPLKKITSFGKIKYYMTKVDGISPNTIVDIAKQNLKLFPWQSTFIWHCYQLITKDGHNIILPSPTSSGKTAITGALSSFISTIETKYKNSIVMIYVAPTSATTLQMASTILNDQKMNRVSIYMSDIVSTSTNPSFICGTPNTLLPLYKIFEIMSKEKKIIVVFDEIHVANFDKQYQEIILRFSRLTNHMIALSATIPNIKELCMQLKYLYNKECISLVTSLRPVRRNFYNNINEPVHAYTNTTTSNVPIDLSAKDLWEALNIKHPKVLQLRDDINNIPISLDSFDNVSKRLKDVLIENQVDTKILFPEIKSKQPDMNELLNTLSTITDDNKGGGSTLVFSPDDPKDLCYMIVNMLHNKTLAQYPYWDILMEGISNICQERARSISKEYLTYKDQQDRAPDPDSEKNSEKKKKDTSNSKIASSRSAETRLTSAWESLILKLQKKYCHDNQDSQDAKKHMKILNKYKSMSIMELKEDYVVPEDCKYNTLNNVTKESIPWTIHVTSTRQTELAFAYGIYYIDDSDTSTTSMEFPNYVMIKIIELLCENKIKVLVLGRYRLSVGMNLPVINVVIYDPEGIVTQAEYDQMEGRPGRKGIDKIGNVYRLINRNVKRTTQAPVNILS